MAEVEATIGAGQIAVIAVTSGLAGGLITTAISEFSSGRRLKREQTHDEQRQARDLTSQATTLEREQEFDERRQRRDLEHQRNKARQAPYTEARKELLPLASRIHRELENVGYYVIGSQVDVVDPEGTPSLDPYEVARELLPDLRRIRNEHPNSAVRRAATKLVGDLRHFYGDLPNIQSRPDDPRDWDRDDLIDHEVAAESLVELMHHDPFDAEAGLQPEAEVGE